MAEPACGEGNAGLGQQGIQGNEKIQVGLAHGAILPPGDMAPDAWVHCSACVFRLATSAPIMDGFNERNGLQ